MSELLNSCNSEKYVLEGSLQAANNGRGEASVFHLVESADGNAARRCHLVDGSLWVFARSLQEFYGSLDGLQDNLL